MAAVAPPLVDLVRLEVTEEPPKMIRVASGLVRLAAARARAAENARDKGRAFHAWRRAAAAPPRPRAKPAAGAENAGFAGAENAATKATDETPRKRRRTPLKSIGNGETVAAPATGKSSAASKASSAPRSRGTPHPYERRRLLEGPLTRRSSMRSGGTSRGGDALGSAS